MADNESAIDRLRRRRREAEEKKALEEKKRKEIQEEVQSVFRRVTSFWNEISTLRGQAALLRAGEDSLTFGNNYGRELRVSVCPHRERVGVFVSSGGTRLPSDPVPLDTALDMLADFVLRSGIMLPEDKPGKDDDRAT